MAASGRPWVIDLDGVVRRGTILVPGAAAAVSALRAAGHPVAFCTNSAADTPEAVRDELVGLGVVGADESATILTSALAVARLLRPGERVLCVAGTGVREAARRRGAHLVEDESAADAVVVGFHRDFDYAAMRSATRAVLGGARLLASNDDAVFPDEDGPAPGCGAILASIERATGRRAEVAGKPHLPMAELVLEHLGGGPAEPGVVVGDSPGTDGGLATRLGWDFGLVLTGNTRPADEAALRHDPAWVGVDLAELVARHG